MRPVSSPRRCRRSRQRPGSSGARIGSWCLPRPRTWTSTPSPHGSGGPPTRALRRPTPYGNRRTMPGTMCRGYTPRRRCRRSHRCNQRRSRRWSVPTLPGPGKMPRRGGPRPRCEAGTAPRLSGYFPGQRDGNNRQDSASAGTKHIGCQGPLPLAPRCADGWKRAARPRSAGGIQPSGLAGLPHRARRGHGVS